MADTFLACNALTNAVIAEIPLVNPQYTRALNDSGTLTGDIMLDDTQVRKQNLVASLAVEPGAVAIYVQRGNVNVWGGLLWSHVYEGKTGKMILNAAEFGSLLSMKVIHSTTVTYGPTELAAQLVSWVTAAFASAGVPMSSTYTVTPTNLTLTIAAWETHVYLDLLKSYAVAAGGVDWAFDIGGTIAAPQAQFTVSYPRRGVRYTTSGVVWDFPGSVLDYSLTKDGQRIAATVIESGAGTGSTMLQRVVAQSPQGHVGLNVIDANNNLTSAADVAAYAQGKLASMTLPPIIATCSLPGSIFFASGVTVGDEVQIATPPSDPYLGGANLPARIVGYAVKGATTSNVEIVDILLGQVL